MKLVKSKQSKKSGNKYKELCEKLDLDPDSDQQYLVVTEETISTRASDEMLLEYAKITLLSVRDNWSEDEELSLVEGYLDSIVDSIESLQCKLFHEHDEEELDDVCVDCREQEEAQKKSEVN